MENGTRMHVVRFRHPYLRGWLKVGETKLEVTWEGVCGERSRIEIAKFDINRFPSNPGVSE